MARPDDLADELRRLALSLPETYEDEPWGHPVFKVADNKMFASMSVAADCVQLTVKLTAEEREIAQLLPYVSEARWVGRYGWITIVDVGAFPADYLRTLVGASYERARFARRRRAATLSP